MKPTRSLLLLATLLAASNRSGAESGPQFHGPTGQGISTDPNPPLKWSATENVAWNPPLPGDSWSSPIVWGNRVFVTTATDGGIATCLNAATGDIVWQEHVDGNFSASPVAAAGRLCFVGDNAETTVIEAGPAFKVLAKNPPGDKVQASPAISQRQIFIRTEKNLFCIGGR